MNPPGTVRLIGSNNRIISFPKPTDDYDDPLNWSIRRKSFHYGVILVYVAVTFSSVDITAFADMTLTTDLSMDDTELARATSFRYIGMALAGILLIPLAYRYGRRPIYIVSLLLQLGASTWMALARSEWELEVSSCIVGGGSAVAHALVPMTITDLFCIHQFASMYGLFVLVQGVGAFVGPILASKIAGLHGNDWRWVLWSMVLAFGATTLLILFCAEESTFVPNIDNQVAAKSLEYQDSEKGNSKRRGSAASTSSISTVTDRSSPDASSTANNEDDNALDLVNINRRSGGGVYLDLPPGPRPLRQRFALVTPTGRPIAGRFLSCFVILARFPGVTYAALTYGLLAAWLSLLNWILLAQLAGGATYSLGHAGLALFNLAPLLGHILGSIAVPMLSDRWIVSRARANGGIYEPEMRLWFALGGGVFVAAGILIFGVGIAQKVDLPVLSLSYVLFSFGLGICLETSLTYITDCYHNMIGDAMVGVVFVRNALAAVIWVGVMPSVGFAGVNDVFIIVSIAASAALLMPVPLLIWGRMGRAATATKYREYSLAATPPASLSKIMGDIHS